MIPETQLGNSLVELLTVVTSKSVFEFFFVRNGIMVLDMSPLDAELESAGEKTNHFMAKKRPKTL